MSRSLFNLFPPWEGRIGEKASERCSRLLCELEKVSYGLSGSEGMRDRRSLLSSSTPQLATPPLLQTEADPLLLLFFRLATLTPSVNATRIRTIIDRLVSLTASNDEGVRDIASLGLKMVVAEVQPGSNLATTCCKDLVPEVLNQVTNVSFVFLVKARKESESDDHFHDRLHHLPSC